MPQARQQPQRRCTPHPCLLRHRARRSRQRHHPRLRSRHPQAGHIAIKPWTRMGESCGNTHVCRLIRHSVGHLLLLPISCFSFLRIHVLFTLFLCFLS
ncbi:hypothetical protein BCR44DRAFT_1437780, partial [Catenaria anguillulae PL171]